MTMEIVNKRKKTMLSVLNSIANVSGDKEKLSLLKQHIDSPYGTDLLLVLNYAYSPRIKFYIKTIPSYTCNSPSGAERMTWFQITQQLDQLSRREITGKAAINHLQKLLEQVGPENAVVVERIIKKDLKIGMGATSINKAASKLIPETPYMGAVSYKKEKVEKLFTKYRRLALQTKMDGRYCNAVLSEEGLWLTSRSGEETMLYDAAFAKQLEQASISYNGVLTGELTIPGIDRYQSNGIINSLITINKKSAAGIDVSKEIVKFEKENKCSWIVMADQIVFTAWDFITLEGYDKGLDETPYADRLGKTRVIVDSLSNQNVKVHLIESKLVYSLEEAMLGFKALLANGEEGAILKATQEKWKDGKPAWQCKLKLDISMDLEVVGFQTGTPGTKNEGKYSVILLQSSDSLLKSRAGGMKESEVDFITKNADNLIGKIVEVRSCGITKVEGSETSALLHPSFVQFRDDKLAADSFQECLDIESAALGILK